MFFFFPNELEDGSSDLRFVFGTGDLERSAGQLSLRETFVFAFYVTITHFDNLAECPKVVGTCTMHSVNLHGNIITNRKGFSGKPPAVSSHIESSRLGVVCLHFDFLRGVLNICPPKYIIRPYASI